MKTQLMKPTVKSVSAITLVFLILTISSQFAVSKTSCIAKAVYYKGEWIAQVDLAEVTIEGEKMTSSKGEWVPYSVLNGEKVAQIDLHEVEVVAYRNEVPELKAATDISLEIKTDSLLTIEKIYSNDELGLEARKNVENKPRPFVNGVLNKLFNAGYKFIHTLNEGLFFRS